MSIVPTHVGAFASTMTAPAPEKAVSSLHGPVATFDASNKGSSPRARTVVVSLRKGAQWLSSKTLGASKPPDPIPVKPTTLKFHNQSAIYEAVFPVGSMPQRGSQADRAVQTLGRLVEAAEAVEGATTLYIGVHGAWVETGSIVLGGIEDEGIAEII